MEAFDSAFARIAGRFRRVEPRRHARAFLLATLSDIDSGTCWQVAEAAGHPSPHRTQRLLGEAVWKADEVRDDLRDYVVETLGTPDAILIIDDTGDLKKGTLTVGVQRQYTGTAGRIENSQVAVYCTYASGKGRALIDREIYLPHSWIDDPIRRDRAGIPEDTTFATKPALARRILTRALETNMPTAWVTTDEGYGGDRQLRHLLQKHKKGYVLAVARDHRVTLTQAVGPQRANHIADHLPSRSWNRRSGGAGAKGERLYDWAWLPIISPDDEADGHHCLLIRRRIRDGELAFYRCWSPNPVPLSALVRVAANRWAVEETFQSSKATVGLDKHQVRRFDSWYRYITLVMFAHAILTAITIHEQTKPTTDTDLIPLTVAEVRRLFAKLLTNTVRTIGYHLAWSHWRRRHQYRAKTSHYRRQQAHWNLRPST